MVFEKAYIPFGGYWSSPYSKWQGSLSHLHAMTFAADVAREALAARGISPEIFENLYMGITVPQKASFYGAPWLAGLIGAGRITGTTISQACATSAKMVCAAAQDIETGMYDVVLSLACDRTSNSPHIYYPNPTGIGGIGDKEDWVWDNFGRDPFAGKAMLATAENVAREAGITKEEQDAVALMRYEQYKEALKDDSAFLKRFMTLPLEVKDRSGRKTIKTLEGDEGVFPTTAEGLAKLKPVMEGGTVSFGTQTFPADGNTAIIVASKEKAAELSRDRNVTVRVLSYGQARVEKAFMPKANIPASRRALARAGIDFSQVKAVKTHNPFALNDIYFAREMGTDTAKMNNYGSSLVYGHPQGPTGARLMVELIEELALEGGGAGLFTGCAAGDSAAAVVIEVDVK